MVKSAILSIMALLVTSCSDAAIQRKDVTVSGYALIFLNKPMFIYSTPSKKDGLTASYDQSMLPTSLRLKMQGLNESNCVSLIVKVRLTGLEDKSTNEAKKEISASKISEIEMVDAVERDKFLDRLDSAALNSNSVCATK